MTDHFHGIIQILIDKSSPENVGKFRSPYETLGSIIRGFKISACKRLKELDSTIKTFERNHYFCSEKFKPKIFEQIDWQL